MNSVRLRPGRTAYELQGPESGVPVVLLHGATVPMWTWDLVVPGLVAAGRRTLRYDLFGQGASDAPRVAYDRDLYRTQLLELLAALKVDAPVHLVGHSFGGAIAANFAARHPDKVRSLALVAPVLRVEGADAMVRLVRTPFLGNLVLRAVAMPRAVRRARALWAGSDDPGDERLARLRAQVDRPGVVAAMRSFYRGDAVGDYSGAYRTIGGAARRTLLVWSAVDGEVPAAHMGRIRGMLPRAEPHELAGVGHGIPFQAADRLDGLLLAHLARADGA